MNIEKRGQLYEGKAKKVFETSDPNYLIVDYKDDATAFNGLKKGTITGKGAINNQMTNYLMQQLEKAGVPTHFVEELIPEMSAGGHSNLGTLFFALGFTMMMILDVAFG